MYTICRSDFIHNLPRAEEALWSPELRRRSGQQGTVRPRARPGDGDGKAPEDEPHEERDDEEARLEQAVHQRQEGEQLRDRVEHQVDAEGEGDVAGQAQDGQAGAELGRLVGEELVGSRGALLHEQQRRAAFALHRSRDTLHLISPSLPAAQQTYEEVLEK